MHTNFLLSACQMYGSWYLFFFWNLPLSCGCGARVIDSTISSRKSTDSDDDIQSPLILRWMKALKGVWNEQLRDKWKIFFCSQKRRERKGEKERRKKIARILSWFFTPLEQRGSGMNVSVQYSLCVSPFTSIITSSARKEFPLHSREYRKVFAEGFHRGRKKTAREIIAFLIEGTWDLKAIRTRPGKVCAS